MKSVDCSRFNQRAATDRPRAAAMAESSTPSVDEQFRIIKALLIEQSNTDTQERYWYMVSTYWIYKWMHHVTHSDKAVYPGKLTMLTDYQIGDILNLKDMDEIMSEPLSPNNVWVREPIWCKWVDWYGVDDGHELTRSLCIFNEGCWEKREISLKTHPTARLANTSKILYLNVECGYMELQLRRIFGVMGGTKTRLLLNERTVLNRSKGMMDYVVRYCTVFF